MYGAALLLASCGISGPNAPAFDVTSCPAFISSASAASILVNCNPSTFGLKSASLTIQSNDSDESSVNFGLRCRGVLSSEDDEIFKAGFEP